VKFNNDFWIITLAVLLIIANVTDFNIYTRILLALNAVILLIGVVKRFLSFPKEK
jgi:hypothetical protein